jgi:hypothetical protein
MSIVALNPSDSVKCLAVDIAIDTGNVDIDQTNLHPREPSAPLTTNLRLEAAFVGEYDERLPGVSAFEHGLSIHPCFADSAGDAVNHSPDGASVDMGDLIKREHGTVARLRKALERVLRGTHALQ